MENLRIEATICIDGKEFPFDFIAIPRIGEHIHFLENPFVSRDDLIRLQVIDVVYLAINKTGSAKIISIKTTRVR